MQERASLPHCGFNTAGVSLWSFSLSCGRSKVRSTSRSSCSRFLRSRNLRQIADALAKGKLAITIGLGRSEYEPFLSAGLPIKEVLTPKEGLPASSGYGVLGIVKNPPHPNTVKVLVNWFWARKDRRCQSHEAGHAPAGCRYEVDVSDCCGCGQGCDDGRGISSSPKPP